MLPLSLPGGTTLGAWSGTLGANVLRTKGHKPGEFHKSPQRTMPNLVLLAAGTEVSCITQVSVFLGSSSICFFSEFTVLLNTNAGLLATFL